MMRNVTAALCLEVIADSRSGYNSLIHLVDTNEPDGYPTEIPGCYLFTKWLVSKEHSVEQTIVRILDAMEGREIYTETYDKKILLNSFVHSSAIPIDGVRISHPGLYMIQLTLKNDKGEEFSSNAVPLIMHPAPSAGETPKQRASSKKVKKKSSKKKQE